MHKENVVYKYIMEYISVIKRRRSCHCDNINGPRGYSAKWNNSDKDKYHMIPLILWDQKINKQKNSKY